jgi:hypothetical protein
MGGGLVSRQMMHAPPSAGIFRFHESPCDVRAGGQAGKSRFLGAGFESFNGN